MNFSKIVFTDESRVTFDRLDGWGNGWTLSKPEVPMTKKKATSVITWSEIVDQTKIGPLEINERVKLNNVEYYEFMDKTFFAEYKSQFRSFKVKLVGWLGFMAYQSL